MTQDVHAVFSLPHNSYQKTLSAKVVSIFIFNNLFKADFLFLSSILRYRIYLRIEDKNKKSTLNKLFKILIGSFVLSERKHQYLCRAHKMESGLCTLLHALII